MNRSVGLCILFTILTCGLYGIYWFYILTKEVSDLSNDFSLSPGLTILFTILTCGLYTIYWSYKMGKNVEIAQQIANINSNDDSMLYLLLTLFGLSIITFAIIQSNINKIVSANTAIHV